MINLNDYLDCPEKLQHIDGRKVVGMYKLKTARNSHFLVEFNETGPAYYPGETTLFKPIPPPQRWQGMSFSIIDGRINYFNTCIIYDSFESATIDFNAAINIDTLEVRRK